MHYNHGKYKQLISLLQWLGIRKKEVFIALYYYCNLLKEVGQSGEVAMGNNSGFGCNSELGGRLDGCGRD